MKTIFLSFLLTGVCFALQDPPLHVRVSAQYIELSHPLLTELLNGEDVTGSALHAKAMALSKTSQTKVLETSMVVCRSGYKARIESVSEEIFPTDYAPVSLISHPPAPMDFAVNPMLRFISAFETKETGISLEVEPTIGENGKIVDLRLTQEFVRRLRLETLMEHKDQWGDASQRIPIFEKWETRVSLILLSGKSELAAVITPKDQPQAPALARRILLFVRADVMELSATP